MANGFKTPIGALMIVGLMGCPLWLWSRCHMPASIYASSWVGAVVVPGRLIAAAVELWVIRRHFVALLEGDCQDIESRSSKSAAGQ